MTRPESPRADPDSDDGRRAFGRYSIAVDIHYADLVTIGLLVLLEGLLSADNALVLAISSSACRRRSSARRCATASSARSCFRILATSSRPT